MKFKEFEAQYKDSIIKLHEAGLRPKVISYRLNVDIGRVAYVLQKYKAYRAKKRNSKEVKILIKKIFYLKQNGMNGNQIGKALNITRNLVNFYISKYKNEGL